jgi:hypothetical protein
MMKDTAHTLRRGAASGEVGAASPLAEPADRPRVPQERKLMTGLDKNIATVCCGWTSRDVALGDGKACMGQLEKVMLTRRRIGFLR